MKRRISLIAILTAVVAGIVLALGVPHGGVASAKGGDPESTVRTFIDAANNLDAAAANAILADDFRFTEANGNGSFAILGKRAFVQLALSGDNGPESHTIASLSVHGDSVSGRLVATNDTSKGAGVDRYVQTYVARVVEEQVVSLDLLFDTTDAQTNTYLEYERNTPSGGDDGSPGDSIEVKLDAGADGSQPGSAFVGGGGDGVSFVHVQVAAGPSGAQQSAAMRAGSCSGAIVYALATVVDGQSDTAFSVGFDELARMHLYLTVSQVDHADRINACGAVKVAAAVPAPVPAAPAPAPAIKPPATGFGPAADGDISSLLAGMAIAGVLAVAAGFGVKARDPR